MASKGGMHTYLKDAQSFFGVPLLHAKLDPHALERGDNAGGRKPFVSLLVERVQPVR